MQIRRKFSLVDELMTGDGKQPYHIGGNSLAMVSGREDFNEPKVVIRGVCVCAFELLSVYGVFL